MLSNIKSFLLIGTTALLLNSCGGAKQEEVDASEEDTATAGVDSQKISAQNVFNTIPSRANYFRINQTS
jgi:PBP1b-binding outer membrane lipoprotein LpoB